MYELVDSMTYKLRSIAPSMWPVFELTYTLFKHEAVDFLEGVLNTILGIRLIVDAFFLNVRNAAFVGQFCFIWRRCHQVATGLHNDVG